MEIAFNTRTMLKSHYVFFALLMVMNSFLCWVLMSVLVLTAYGKNKNFLRFWSVMSIVFVSLINATKIPENDLSWYVEYYLAAEYTKFIDYLYMLPGGKEKLYQIIVYVIHIFGGGNYHIFVFTVSIITYGFTLAALNLICDELKIGGYNYVFIIFMLCFFPYTFAMSVHQLRQFIAISICFYLLIYCHLVERNWVVVLLGMSTFFIHSCAIVYVPFFFLRTFSSSINRNNILIYLGMVVGILSLSLVASQLMPLVTESESLKHIANKAANGTTFEVTADQFKLSHWSFMFGLVILVFVALYYKKSPISANKSVNIVFNTFAVILIFILLNFKNVELQARYARVYWELAATFVCVYVARWKINRMLLTFGCVMLFFSWLYYNSYMSLWSYTSHPNFWYYTLPMYFVD